MVRILRLVCWIFIVGLGVASIAILLLMACVGLVGNSASESLMSLEIASLLLLGTAWLIPLIAGLLVCCDWWRWPQPATWPTFRFFLVIQTGGMLLLLPLGRNRGPAGMVMVVLAGWFGVTATVLWSLLTIAWLRRSKGKDSHGDSPQLSV